MLGFTFNDIHCSEFGIVMRSTNRQMLPPFNDAYVQIPGRQGGLLFPGGLGDRRIELDCAFKEKNLPDIRAKARKVAAFLYTEKRSVLRFDDEPDKYYMAKIDREVNFTNLAVVGEFTLNFRCGPLAYGAEQEISFLNDTVTVDNIGTYRAPPSLDIDFMGNTTEIKISKGTDYIRVVHSFKAGDKLHVADGKVLINGVRAMDKLDWQNSRFFDLTLGENVLNITPLGKCAATVKYIPRWL